MSHPSLLEQLSALGYHLIEGASRFVAAMSSGLAVYAQDQVGAQIKISCTNGVLSATPVAQRVQLVRSWFQVHRYPSAAALFDARVEAAEQRFLSGVFGYSHESSEPWFEEAGMLVKVIYSQHGGQLVQTEARVSFVAGTAAIASTQQFNVTEAISEAAWEPTYSKWRHGGWYVYGIKHLNGASGCVSNNYADGKWRIVCDPRRDQLDEVGDFTFATRNDAAHGERALIREQVLALLAKRKIDQEAA